MPQSDWRMNEQAPVKKLQQRPGFVHVLGEQTPAVQVLPDVQNRWVSIWQSDPQHAPGWSQGLGEHAPPTVQV